MYFVGAGASGANSSPWNAVTIATAVIASLGLAISLWNAWGSWRKDHPKVHMKYSWSFADDDYEMLTGAARFSVTNRGPGVAEDVRIAVDELPSVKKRATVAFGDSVEVLFAEKGKMGEPIFLQRLSDYATVSTSPDIEFIGAPRVTVTWHQRPNLKKKHSKTWKYKRPKTMK